MNITVDELVMMLGTRDVELYALQKQLAEAQKKIAELTPKPDTPPLKAVE